MCLNKKKSPSSSGAVKKKAELCSEDNHSGGIMCILLLGEVQSRLST